MVKRILNSVVIIVIAATFAVTSHQASAVSQAVRCAPIVLNVQGCHGYVTRSNLYWTPNWGINGGPIIYSASTYAIPFSVNSAATLESYMAGLLGMGNPTDYSYGYNKSGAAFIIDTMLGHLGGFPSVNSMIQYAKDNFYPNAGNNWIGWTTWMDYYDSGTNPSYSVDWGSPGVAINVGPGMINTLHACPAGTPSNVCQTSSGAMPVGAADAKDFAWFAMGPGEFESTHPITFYGPSGVTYMLRRECANPIGGPVTPLPPPQLTNYKLQPNVTPVITDSAGKTVSGNTAQVGDTITFTYAIDNKGTDPSPAGTSCTVYGKWYSGVHTVPSPADSSPVLAPQPATGCPRAFPSGNQTLATEAVAVTGALANGTVCRSLYVSPSDPGTPSLGNEACVTISAQPYFKVFGGDVSVGEGIAGATGSCAATDIPQAAIQSWNQESTGGYAGSGVQYAARALAALTDFAAGQNGGSGGAPFGLAFANTTASGASVFGGSLGSPFACMNDYYDTTGASALTTNNVSSLTTGKYSSASGVTLVGGNVNPNQRTQVYVQGNVYISGNITYTGSWSVSSMPLFELVVKGNIYIDSNVTRLDGMYVAEPNGSPGSGTVYTCATAANTPCATASPTFYTTAGNQLTINGSVVANQVQLLRTHGTLSQSSAGESPSATSGAEVFNYDPAFWIAQPPTTTTGTGNGSSSAGTYDSISSLPPIL